MLQLNFCRDHDREFESLFGADNGWLLRSDGHPMSKRWNTLAWARLDIDLDEGTMLIEEIQSDWVRSAASFARNARGRWLRLERSGNHIKGVSTLEQFHERAKRYANFVLPDHSSFWQEKMMAACMFFAFSELGLQSIFMHTYDAGNLLKGIDTKWRAPPRSIYSDIPKRMGFSQKIGGPSFLAPQLRATKIRRAGGERLPFWHLSVSKACASQAIREGGA